MLNIAAHNFWKPLEMPLINLKVQLKLRWARYCVLGVRGAENEGNSSDSIIFIITGRKFHVPVVMLPAKTTQQPSKLLSDGSWLWLTD